MPACRSVGISSRRMTFPATKKEVALMDIRRDNAVCVPGSSGAILPASPGCAVPKRAAKTAFQLEKGERAAALLCLGMGILYARWMLEPPAVLYQQGRWVLAAVLGCFFICIEASARLCRIACPRESWFWAAVFLSQSIGCGLFGNQELAFFPFLLSHLAAAQWALVRCGGAVVFTAWGKPCPNPKAGESGGGCWEPSAPCRCWDGHLPRL